MKNTLSITLALLFTMTTTAFASDGAKEVAEEGPSLASRFGVGADVRGRVSVFTNYATVMRSSIEFAALEPAAGQSGVRLDAMAGLGYADGLYVDVGGQIGYEFHVFGEGAVAVLYGATLSREESTSVSGFSSLPPYTVFAPVSLDHQLQVEFGLQQALRLRVGGGVSQVVAYDSVDVPGENGNLSTLSANIGLVWRL